jgi:hypothetical protein
MTNPSNQDPDDMARSGEADRATAALERAFTGTGKLPGNLRARLIDDGEAFFDRRARRTRGWWQRRVPVPVPLALAAGLALAVSMLALLAPGDRQLPETATELEARLSDAGALELAWEGLGDPAFAAVSGRVLWSTAAQAGVLRIANVPANDRSQAQYQLWIIDPSRDDEPVDGGVFDLAPGENLVPIDGKLAVIDPRAFAVTLEKPGGVVVSDGPLLFVATVDRD